MFSYNSAGKDRGLLQSKTFYTEEGLTAGVVTTYAYDSKNQLKTATEKNGTTVTASWAYEYDASVNRTKTTNTGATGTTNGTISYTYNDANQISSSTTNTAGWSYDDAGNLLKDPDSTLDLSYSKKAGTTSISKNGAKTDYQYYDPGNTNRGENGSSYEYQTQTGLEATKTVPTSPPISATRTEIFSPPRPAPLAPTTSPTRKTVWSLF